MNGPLRKQFGRIFEAVMMNITGIAADADSSGDDVVTAALTTAAATASRSGGPVPVQVGTIDTTEGFITSGALNIVRIKGVDGGGVESPDNTEVYGRLTEAGAVYTLSYYYLNASGVETAYTGFAGETITCQFPYVFKFENVPASAFLAMTISDVNTVGASQNRVSALITPTGQNVLPNLPSVPSGSVSYVVNSLSYDELTGGAISRTGQALTWSAANAGFNAETTDRIVANYITA